MLTASNILRASSRRHIWQRSFHDYVRYATPGMHYLQLASITWSLTSSARISLAGTARLPLTSHKLIGVSSSRGTRAYVQPVSAVPIFRIPNTDTKKTLQASQQYHSIQKSLKLVRAVLTALIGIR